MINAKTIGFRVKPYMQEAALQMVIDIFIMVAVFLVLMVAGFSWAVCVAVVTGYIIIALPLHYNVAIQAIIDKRKGEYITETLSIKRFTEEFSFSGNRTGHGNVRLFYPDEMRVCKYKITVTDEFSEEKKLRAVMSSRRLLNFAVLDKQQIKYLQITYLKRSKILIGIDLVEKSNKNVKKQVVDKTIFFINQRI